MRSSLLDIKNADGKAQNNQRSCQVSNHGFNRTTCPHGRLHQKKVSFKNDNPSEDSQNSSKTRKVRKFKNMGLQPNVPITFQDEAQNMQNAFGFENGDLECLNDFILDIYDQEENPCRENTARLNSLSSQTNDNNFDDYHPGLMSKLEQEFLNSKNGQDVEISNAIFLDNCPVDMERHMDSLIYQNNGISPLEIMSCQQMPEFRQTNNFNSCPEMPAPEYQSTQHFIFPNGSLDMNINNMANEEKDVELLKVHSATSDLPPFDHPDVVRLLQTLQSEVMFSNQQTELATQESSRNAQLKSAIVDLKEALADVRQKNQDLEQKYESLQENYDATSRTLTQLEGSTRTMLDRFMAFKSQHSSCGTREHEMKAKLMEVAHKLSKAEQTAADVQDAHNNCVEILNNIHLERKRLEDENRRLHSEASELQELRTQLNEKIAETTEMESCHADEILKYREEIGNAEAHNFRLKSELEGLKCQNNQLLEQMKKSYEEAGGFQQQLRKREVDMKALNYKLQRQDKMLYQMSHRYRELTGKMHHYHV